MIKAAPPPFVRMATINRVTFGGPVNVRAFVIDYLWIRRTEKNLR